MFNQKILYVLICNNTHSGNCLGYHGIFQPRCSYFHSWGCSVDQHQWIMVLLDCLLRKGQPKVCKLFHLLKFSIPWIHCLCRLSPDQDSTHNLLAATVPHCSPIDVFFRIFQICSRGNELQTFFLNNLEIHSREIFTVRSWIDIGSTTMCPPLSGLK